MSEPVEEIVYGVFCGPIDERSAQGLVNKLTIAMNLKAQHVHILFQTAGGYIAEGVFLYNFLRTVPIEVTLYNGGQVSSAGVIAYLGARHRKAMETASFLVHRSTQSPQFANSSKLQSVAKSLVSDDERLDMILRKHITMPPDLWTEMQYHDVYLSGEEAVKYGLADELADFAPPIGTQVYNMLP